MTKSLALLFFYFSTAGAAFAPGAAIGTRSTSAATATTSSSSSIAAVAGAATSFEEDLELTLKVIMDHQERSATSSTEQMLSEVAQAESSDEPSIDVSIPYDAPARLAYSALGDDSVDYETFKAEYEAEMVALVISKKAAPPPPKKKAAPKKKKAPAPAPAKAAAKEEEGPEIGAGGMADTRNPDAYVDEDPRKSISEAPSFEEYLKSRQ